MNIGIDGGAISVSDDRLKVGVYQVCVNLFQRLGELDHDNTYYIYSFLPIGEFGPRMENKVLRPQKGWFTLRLPLELRLHPVDVFLGVSQAIPTGVSRAIGFIYDLGFLYHPEAYPGSYEKLKKQTEQLVRRSQRIVTISNSVKSDLQKVYGLSNEKIAVAHPGVDKRFTKKGKILIGEFPYFLFVGALKPGKNVPRLIEAFAQFLKKEKKLFDLYLVGGDYWLDPHIEVAIKKYKLEKRVKKLGFVPDEKLPDYYRGAVAFVSPSLHEGFCMPAVEAMACGCPVIGSAQGAMPEIIGEAGLVVEPTDIDAIVRAMQNMAYNAKQRNICVVRGLKQARKYSWDTFAKTVLHEIQTVSNRS